MKKKECKKSMKGNRKRFPFCSQKRCMPSWGALIVRDNAAENKGRFGVCSGVCSFFGGGTFLAVNEFSEHKADAG